MPAEDFKEVVTLIDPVDKLVQVPITVRETPDGKKHSFALLREFVRDGQDARTPWFFRRHIPGLRRALDELENYFEKTEREQRKAGR